ncbi:MAG: 4Fe-4S dicluster domain-containing protein [Clostridia bacterium]|nr:4Fe-4S dicluster domain-containing protein [Clostridia bacterium]
MDNQDLTQKYFDTKVQYLKYRALRQVAKYAWEGVLTQKVLDIPKEIVSGKKATMRCCVYKERAIMAERVKMAMGGNPENPNMVEVIDIACDDCPSGGYEVTSACRGCLAHRCEQACKKGAITFDQNQKAHIDKSKCVECGLCAKVCPYSAISNLKRPCEKSCKVKAISMREDKAACIDNDKCIGCGACVYQCPFGAITEKSFILDVIALLKDSMENKTTRVYAVVAPSIASQFVRVPLGKVVAGLKKLGFFAVVEAALGADMVARDEAGELLEKDFLMSSCCPSFVRYVERQFPNLAAHLSAQLSPMARIAEHIKKNDSAAKVVFVGPCISKKEEALRPEVRPWVDNVITFEELQALFDSRDIELAELAEDSLDNASYFGRIFARSGGLTEAVRQALREKGVEESSLNPCVCDGIEQCRVALLKASKGVLPNNFVEGMACVGGCIGGPGCLTHGEKNRADVDKYGREAKAKTIADAIDAEEIE